MADDAPKPPVVVLFACTRGRDTNRCKECGSRATGQCQFPLRGTSAGKTCGAYLCERCAVVIDRVRHYCPPHARLNERERTEALEQRQPQHPKET